MPHETPCDPARPKMRVPNDGAGVPALSGACPRCRLLLFFDTATCTACHDWAHHFDRVSLRAYRDRRNAELRASVLGAIMVVVLGFASYWTMRTEPETVVTRPFGPEITE